jgi:putative iron-dependent peroxidase
MQDGVTHAVCIEWRCDLAASEALARLTALRPASATVGIGAPLAERLGIAIPGLRPFNSMVGVRTLPATQCCLWALVPGADTSAAYDAAAALVSALGPGFEATECTSLFRYRAGRNLLGYRDGAANPRGKLAARAAFLGKGPWQHATFALVQRFRHDASRFAALTAEAQDAVLGVSRGSGNKLESAPASAHVRRVDPDGVTHGGPVVRRTLPWGTPPRNGEQHIAFSAELERFDLLLARMTGLEDGIGDALLEYSVAETGAYYFCPPLDGGRLQLTPD